MNHASWDWLDDDEIECEKVLAQVETIAEARALAALWAFRDELADDAAEEAEH